jgi:hypothetical protein
MIQVPSHPPHKGEGLTRPHPLMREWDACRIASPPVWGRCPAGQRGSYFNCDSRTLVGRVAGRGMSGEEEQEYSPSLPCRDIRR